MYSNTFREIRRSISTTQIIYLVSILVFCLTVYFTARLFAEKYAPMKDANFIDIFNSEEVTLRRGGTATVTPPPSVIEAMYADKGMVYRPEKKVYRKLF